MTQEYTAKMKKVATRVEKRCKITGVVIIATTLALYFVKTREKKMLVKNWPN